MRTLSPSPSAVMADTHCSAGCALAGWCVPGPITPRAITTVPWPGPSFPGSCFWFAALSAVPGEKAEPWGAVVLPQSQHHTPCFCLCPLEGPLAGWLSGTTMCDRDCTDRLEVLPGLREPSVPMVPEGRLRGESASSVQIRKARALTKPAAEVLSGFQTLFSPCPE